MIQLTSDSFFSDDDTEILPLVTKLGLLDGLSKPVGWEGPIVKTVYGPLKSGGHAIFVRWMDMPDSSENGYIALLSSNPKAVHSALESLRSGAMSGAIYHQQLTPQPNG